MSYEQRRFPPFSDRMKSLICIIFLSPLFALTALPPQLTEIRGFLQHREGPLEDFTENLAGIPQVHAESTFLNPQPGPQGRIYRADYLFDDAVIRVYRLEDDLSGAYLWQTRNQLCTGRSLQILNDRGLFGTFIEQGSAFYLVLLQDDSQVDICDFIDVFFPLQAYFSGGETPQFPGTLGTLP